MSIPPLCIIQARLNSKRLPRKMFLPLGGLSLIQHAHRIACKAFGENNVVVAIPDRRITSPLGIDDLALELERIGATTFAWDGPEENVLGRFYYCAHTYRWHPNTVIIRYTPDDPFKTPAMLRRVARGERLPVEWGGEAFTLEQLDKAMEKYDYVRDYRSQSNIPTPQQIQEENRRDECREHITYALFDVPAPSAGPGVWSIDTHEDFHAVRDVFEKRARVIHAADCACQDCTLQAFGP